MAPLAPHRETDPPASPAAPGRTGFSLCKWYMDAVGPDGHAAIAYWAAVRWGPLAFTYSGLLETSPSAPVRSTSTARRCAPPEFVDGLLTWSSPRLGVCARWESAAPPYRSTLLSGPQGAVDWACLLPRARARLSTPSGTIQGWGYAERLTLTMRPWRLPIDELSWGRFLNDDASIVWIRWRGPEPRMLVLRDGRELAEPQIQDGGIIWPGGRLTLSPGRTLRHGALGSTVLASHSLLRAMTPRTMRALREHKSLSRAELTLADRRPSSGWAIHEIVDFRSPP